MESGRGETWRQEGGKTLLQRLGGSRAVGRGGRKDLDIRVSGDLGVGEASCRENWRPGDRGKRRSR